MHNNPYSSSPRGNPWPAVGWILVMAGLFGLFISNARASESVSTVSQDLISDAWLVHHGIETSQWKDPTCKALALDLVDESKLTKERLSRALQLALNADTETCGKKGINTGKDSALPRLDLSGSRSEQAADVQQIQELFNAVRWIDESCNAAAYELANIAPDEVASKERMEAAVELIERSTTARNCRVGEGYLIADVGSFSDAPNACVSSLIMDPNKSPYIKRICPLGVKQEKQ